MKRYQRMRASLKTMERHARRRSARILRLVTSVRRIRMMMACRHLPTSAWSSLRNTACRAAHSRAALTLPETSKP